jgi:hypothetical protein
VKDLEEAGDALESRDLSWRDFWRRVQILNKDKDNVNSSPRTQQTPLFINMMHASNLLLLQSSCASSGLPA